MSARRGLAVACLGALALAGHWLFWYQPRLHPAAPGDDLPGRLLASDGFDSVLWLAHPHQNLPSLADATGLDAAGLAAALRLAGLEAPRLEGVRLPPASSLALAVRGDQWLVAARVYPAAAAFVRLAGALADNPWFAGGGVRVDGAAITVAWQGTTWSASSDAAAFPSRRDGAPGRGAALAWISHRAGATGDPGTLPDADLSLRAGDGFVELASRDADSSSPLLADGRAVLAAADSLLLAVARGGDDPPQTGQFPDQALLLLPLPTGTDPSELPRAAILHRPDSPEHRDCRRWDLPGESLLKVAGHDRPRGARAGWQADATDAPALGSALAAAPGLRALADAAGRLPRWAVWLDVAPAARELDRLARGLDGSPLVAPGESRRWRDAAQVLAALARRPARVEGYVDGGEVMLRWTATE